jgi:titin
MTPTQPRASSLSKSISITPLQKPQIVKHLQNATFRQGDVALIQCIAKGSPDTIVKWYRNDQQIEPTDEYAMAYDHSNGLCSLSVAEASARDSGQYTCVATNSVGSESSTAWIIIKEASQERSYSQSQQQQQQPAKRVGARPGFQKQTTPLRLGSIESSRVEASYEQQQYQQVSEISSVDSSGRPRVLEPLKDVEFVEAASALLECRIQGTQLNIQWYKATSQIQNQFRYKMSYDEISGMSRLFIATVLEDDAGEYTCRAVNSFGEASTSAHLIPIGNHEFRIYFYNNNNFYLNFLL